jgi:hypothetical protein
MPNLPKLRRVPSKINSIEKLMTAVHMAILMRD